MMSRRVYSRFLVFSLVLTWVGCLLGCTKEDSQPNANEITQSEASTVAVQPVLNELEVKSTAFEISPEPVKLNTDPKLSEKLPAPSKKRVSIPPEPLGVNGLQPFVEASDKLMSNPLVQNLRKQAKGKVQVIEFFNYPCPWCAHIEPVLKQWLKTKSKDVIFIRIPVLFHPNWSNFSKVYYIIEALAVKKHIQDTTPIHAAFFEASKQNFQINQDLSALYAFFVQQGLMPKENEKTFIEMLNAMDDRPKIPVAYGIKAIPTFVVQGKKGIYSTSMPLADTPENMFATIDYLTAINSQ